MVRWGSEKRTSSRNERRKTKKEGRMVCVWGTRVVRWDHDLSFQKLLSLDVFHSPSSDSLRRCGWFAFWCPCCLFTFPEMLINSYCNYRCFSDGSCWEIKNNMLLVNVWICLIIIDLFFFFFCFFFFLPTRLQRSRLRRFKVMSALSARTSSVKDQEALVKIWTKVSALWSFFFSPFQAPSFACAYFKCTGNWLHLSLMISTPLPRPIANVVNPPLRSFFGVIYTSAMFLLLPLPHPSSLSSASCNIARKCLFSSVNYFGALKFQ